MRIQATTTLYMLYMLLTTIEEHLDTWGETIDTSLHGFETLFVRMWKLSPAVRDN